MSEEKKSFWLTFPGILTGIAAVITATTGLYAVIKNKHPESPAATIRTLDNKSGEVDTESPGAPGNGIAHSFTQSHAESLEKAEKVAVQWFTALRRQDLGTLLALTEKPFYDGDGRGAVLLSDADIVAKYNQPEIKGTKEPQFSHLRANTVSDWKRENVLSGRERVFSAIRVEDTDIMVSMRLGMFPQLTEEQIQKLPEALRGGLPLWMMLRQYSSGFKVLAYW